MIIPVLHRILVKPRDLTEANETYKKMKAMGLEIPDVSDVKREEKAVEIGEVVAVGETAFTGPFETSVKPNLGDVVYFAKYAGKEVIVNGEKRLILNDEDIIAIIKE